MVRVADPSGRWCVRDTLTIAVPQNGRSNGGFGCAPCLDAAEFRGAGFASGMFVAIILDVALLAFEEPRVPSSAQIGVSQWHLTPIAGLPRDSNGRAVPAFGIAGSFLRARP